MVLNVIPDPPVPFEPERITYRLKMYGLSQSDLARSLGVSRQRVSQMLLRQDHISSEMEKKLEDVLDAPQWGFRP